MFGLSHLLTDLGIKLDFNLSVLHLNVRQMFVVYINCTYVTKVQVKDFLVYYLPE